MGLVYYDVCLHYLIVLLVIGECTVHRSGLQMVLPFRCSKVGIYKAVLLQTICILVLLLWKRASSAHKCGIKLNRLQNSNLVLNLSADQPAV